MRISDWSSDVCSSDLGESEDSEGDQPQSQSEGEDSQEGDAASSGMDQADAADASGGEAAEMEAEAGMEQDVAGSGEEAGKGRRPPHSDLTGQNREPTYKAFTKQIDEVKIGRASCRKECVSTCRSRWSPHH